MLKEQEIPDKKPNVEGNKSFIQLTRLIILIIKGLNYLGVMKNS